MVDDHVVYSLPHRVCLQILEIGCGAGSVLDALKVEGANPDFLYGVDLNAKSVQLANENHSFNVSHHS